jgi:hypothetical protein
MTDSTAFAPGNKGRGNAARPGADLLLPFPGSEKRGAL